MMRRQCSVEGCVALSRSDGFCVKHYQRWRKHGDPLFVLRRQADFGLPWKMFQEAREMKRGGCFIWPYARDKAGYARVHPPGSDRTQSASRLMCVAVYGPSPTDKHEAAHNCGRGAHGCISPYHLRWATRRENESDKALHGIDQLGEKNPSAKLTEESVRLIRSMVGSRSQQEIAMIFGVDQANISAIHRGKTWKHVR